MMRHSLSKTNDSESVQHNPDYILETEKCSDNITKCFSIEKTVQEKGGLDNKPNRNITKVLFISRDESLLNSSKQSLDGYTNISDLFTEVHILILRTGIKKKNPALRVAKNVWLYTASSKDWWRTPFTGMDIVKEQLVFANEFRPD